MILVRQLVEENSGIFFPVKVPKVNGDFMAKEHSEATLTVLDDSQMVYITVEKRAAFDAIPLPVEPGKNCLAKSQMEAGKIWIIFQFWGEKP